MTHQVPKVADTLRLNRSNGEVLIDGEPLGFAIADEPFQVTVDPSGTCIVRIPILARSYGDLGVDEPATVDAPEDDDWFPTRKQAS